MVKFISFISGIHGLCIGIVIKENMKTVIVKLVEVHKQKIYGVRIIYGNEITLKRSRVRNYYGENIIPIHDRSKDREQIVNGLFSVRLQEAGAQLHATNKAGRRLRRAIMRSMSVDGLSAQIKDNHKLGDMFFNSMNISPVNVIMKFIPRFIFFVKQYLGIRYSYHPQFGVMGG